MDDGCRVDFPNYALRKLFTLRPTIELQTEPSDCGYVCISAIMALLGRPMMVHEIKELVGTTARGLKLKQLRDGLRECGADAEAIFFDRARPDAYPTKGILLLSRGHYVVLGARRGDRFEVFDPQLGWSWIHYRKLRRRCEGFGIHVRGLTSTVAKSNLPKRSLALGSLLGTRRARITACVFALAQAITLLLPLLSMWSVDKSIGRASLGLFGTVAVGVAALSATNIVISLWGEILQSKVKRMAAVMFSRTVFDSLAEKPPYWFELNSAASLQNRVGSVNTLLDFHVEVVRTVGTLAITVVVGLAALLFISPWLVVPGLCSLLLSIVLDLSLDRSQRSHIASALETSQQRQAFVLDTLWQLPVIARYGSLAPARMRFASLVRVAAAIDAKLQSLRGWRTALGMLLKSGETVFFVTLSATFMAAGDFSIGGFVALGAYKDLIANSISTAFQLAMRRRTMEVHMLQAATILTSNAAPRATPCEIAGGDVVFEGVSFAYGSLDPAVLSNVSFRAHAGECTAIRGPSGCGKSTIAKLVMNALVPIQGRITIDGLAPANAMRGVSAVLQSDRLIAGTIRDNIVMFRRGITDVEVLAALHMASIDDFVLGLPMRLNTLVGEGAAGLSGGQRQRLLLARALLEKPRLVVLDEATSSLDVATEDRILSNIRASGATTILIAHRPEVWALADRIYSFNEHGRLTEDGAASPRALAS